MTTFGLHLTDFSGPQFSGTGLLGAVTDIADALEQSPAFTTLWLTDHMQNLGPAGPAAPMPEAYSLLNAVAARTSTLRLGVLATSVLYRHPQFLAKTVCTLDLLSGGRSILGIGAGHPRTEVEHVAFGYEFPDVGSRMHRLESALETIRPMIGSAGIPVLVAGSGEQRLLRIAARHADMINLSFPSGDSIDRIAHKREVLARHCATVGRDPEEIAVTYKAILAVDETAQRAREQWRQWRSARAVPDVGSRAGVFVGSPDEIAEQFEPWLHAGIAHFVVEFTRTDAASIALADRALAALRADSGRAES